MFVKIFISRNSRRIRLKWTSLYVIISVLQFSSTTVHPIDLTIGRCITEDPKEAQCVKCEVVWMSGFKESCKQWYPKSNRPIPNQHVLNRHCTFFGFGTNQHNVWHWKKAPDAHGRTSRVQGPSRALCQWCTPTGHTNQRRSECIRQNCLHFLLYYNLWVMLLTAAWNLKYKSES